MKKFILFTLMALLVVGATSCRYDEGPFVSVIPRTERVSNTWIVGQAIVDGQTQSELSGFKQVTFYKEGNCNMILTALGAEFAYSGTWAFTDGDEAITYTVTDELTGFITITQEWTILKLKEDDLWVTYTETDNSGNTTNYEVHLVTKAG